MGGRTFRPRVRKRSKPVREARIKMPVEGDIAFEIVPPKCRRLDASLREFLEAADLRSEHWQGGTKPAALGRFRSVLAKRNEAYPASGNSTKP